MSWRVWRWGLAGIGLYLLCLLAMFPAGYAVAWLQARVPEVRFGEVHGSVWAGTAREVAWQGQPWGSLRWRFAWGSLFAGHLGYQLYLTATEFAIQARVTGNSRNLLLQDVNGKLPVSRLQPWLPLPSGSLEGELNIKMQRLILVDGLPTAAAGVVNLTRLKLTWPQSITLGDYQLKLQTQADGIHGSLLDTSGPLMLQGSLRLAPDGSYQLNGVLASRDSTDVALNNLLRYLPSKPDGKHSFAFSGRWQKGE